MMAMQAASPALMVKCATSVTMHANGLKPKAPTAVTPSFKPQWAKTVTMVMVSRRAAPMEQAPAWFAPRTVRPKQGKPLSVVTFCFNPNTMKNATKAPTMVRRAPMARVTVLLATSRVSGQRHRAPIAAMVRCKKPLKFATPPLAQKTVRIFPMCFWTIS